MGRIVATVDIENFSETDSSMKLDAPVDTGASYLALPLRRKVRFGAVYWVKAKKRRKSSLRVSFITT